MFGISRMNQTDGKQMRRVGEIKLHPEFKALFPINKSVKESIEASIRKEGFNEEFPLVIWKEKDVLIDGHTRLAAAKSALLKSVPVVYKSFEEKQDAIDYALTLQFNRRNLQDSDLFSFVLTLDTENLPGSGRKQEKLAKACSISTTKAVRILKVKKECSEYQKKQILEGSLSINSVYNKLKKKGVQVDSKRRKAGSCTKKTLVIDKKKLESQIAGWYEDLRDENHVFYKKLEVVLEILPDNEYVILLRERYRILVDVINP